MPNSTFNKSLGHQFSEKVGLDLKEMANPCNVTIGFILPDGTWSHSIDYATFKKVEINRVTGRPTFFLPAKFEIILKSRKRFIIIIGGRGSGKSIGIGRMQIADMLINHSSYYCLREFQKSVKDSVYSLLKNQIKNIYPDRFLVLDKEIRTKDCLATFDGIKRNPESIKSAYGFQRYWVEEAQVLTQNSLQILTPTARKEDSTDLPLTQKNNQDPKSAQLIFTGNPSSTEDPFSKRLINPFIDKLDDNGIYEDDLHLVVFMNFCDNPWFMESGLEEERLFDEIHLDRALYKHIWEGDFNDSVEYALIKANWFDACVDAFDVLKIRVEGVKKATHDPSDTGQDPKAVCLREGNFIADVDEQINMDVNEGSDWAIAIAKEFNVDQYEWDCGGMGIALKKDVNKAFEGKRVEVHQFSGQSKVDMPNKIYESSGASNMRMQMKICDVVKNLRAQCYLSLRDRIYRTYRFVMFNEAQDPATLISISSNCKQLQKLRSELCRMPVKPTMAGKFELYTKKELRDKFNLPSPNLADCLMMSERVHLKEDKLKNVHTPKKVNYW